MSLTSFPNGIGNVVSSAKMVAGSGVLSGTGTVYRSSTARVGDIITTQILIDITGLNSSAAADIIGDNAAANCHFGQITALRNGTILGGKITCLEAPATGINDIDFYAADEATGTEDTAITALTNDTALFAPGAAWTIDMYRSFTGIPAADQYLYLVGSGAGADATYTTGKFLIELFGYVA